MKPVYHHPAAARKNASFSTSFLLTPKKAKGKRAYLEK